MKNPFRYNGPIYKDDPDCGVTFVSRILICKKIQELIQQGEYIQVVGPHQSGRTTLAIDLCDRLISEDILNFTYIPVLISCESLMDVCREGFIKTAIARLHKVVKEYLKEKPYDGVRDIFDNPVLPTTLTNFLDFLIDCGKELAERAAFVILLDEMEALPDSLVGDVLRLLRSLFHNYADRRCGSPYRVVILTTQDLSYWQLRKSSPFNMSNIVPLEPFSRQELDTLFDGEHVGKILPVGMFEDSARERIYYESGGHPYFVQRLCYFLTAAKIGRGSYKVNGQDVELSLFNLFEKGDQKLQILYGKIPGNSREWKICKKISAGRRVLFEADDPAIKNMVEQGFICDENHYCQFSANVYNRQICKRLFQEQFSDAVKSFSERHQLLLHISCLQKILLNAEVITSMESRFEEQHNDNLFEGKDFQLHCEYLNELIKNNKLYIDEDEGRAFVDYYNLKPPAETSELLNLLVRIFHTALVFLFLLFWQQV